MLTLINGSAAVPLMVDDYYVRQIDTGYDQLKFDISIFDPLYQQIQEESVILERSGAVTAQRYIVKAIDGGGETAQIVAELDLDDWRASLTLNYTSGSNYAGVIMSAVKPAGWTVTDATSRSIRRTISVDAATPLDVADACREAFDVCMRWDTINKKVTIIEPSSYSALGAFIAKDLNLKENNYKGKSSDFCTRLYPYGADGLSIADVNGGVPYLDNNTYSSKVICGYWKDERYTNAANLKYDATIKLAGLAVPTRSYDCSVYDLARTNPDKYSYQDFSLFAVIALIDTTRANAKIYHQVVETWVYPYYPTENKVVLSTSPAKVQSQLSNLTTAVTSPISSWTQEQKAAQSVAIENATDQITGNNGGNILISLNSDGKPYEICIMDTLSKTTAQKVWRWNLSGLGYSNTGYNGTYGLAMTQDGSIVADYIRTGALSSSSVTVGGFTLSSSSLHNGMTSFNDTTHDGVYIGTDGIALGKGNFKVDAEGNLTAKTGTFTGDVYAANIKTESQVTGAGYITGSQIGTSTISGSNIDDYTISGSNIAYSTVSGSNIASRTISSSNIAQYSVGSYECDSYMSTGAADGYYSVDALAGSYTSTPSMGASNTKLGNYGLSLASFTSGGVTIHYVKWGT